MIRSAVLAFAGLLATGPACALYNANMVGQIEGFYVYTEGDYIYFRLRNQPTSHPTCGPNYFVIHESVPADRRKLIYARLAQAHATQEPINIGYDASGDCAHGYIRVHRVG